jgi:histidinol dehydrogenase
MKIWHLDKEYAEFINAVGSAKERRKSGVRDAVETIKSNVLKRKEKALADYGRKFDGWKKDYPVKASADELTEAAASVSRNDLRVLKGMIKNVTLYHRSQKQPTRTYRREGLTVTDTVVPVERALVYVPGGKAAYPSSLVMGTVPAKIAGVKEIYVTTPTFEGRINPYVAAAALMLDITGLYRLGGAQAIYAFSYGVGSVPKVDVIVGPGNAYVEEAKRDVYGTVGIDMLAGPSELIILAAGPAVPSDVLVWDLFSQAEHDEMAVVGLFSPSKEAIYELLKSMERLAASNPRKEIIEKALSANGFLVHYSRIEDAVKAINAIAPEHLEVIGDDKTAGLIDYSGVTYVGGHTCVAMGDYYIGTNHVLPTGGAGRFSSGLSVAQFTKRKVLVKINKAFLKKYGAQAARLAEIEGLQAHAEAIRARKGVK